MKRCPHCKSEACVEDDRYLRHCSEGRAWRWRWSGLDEFLHGSYIHDYGNDWRRVRELTQEQVAELLVTAAIQVHDTSVFVEAPRIACDPSRRGYMWTNKGFIVVDFFGQKLPPDRGCVKSGMTAVYLHDGAYCLYERRGA